MSPVQKGHKQSEDQIRKRVEARQRFYETDEGKAQLIAEGEARRGREVSQATRDKLSDAAKARPPISEVTRQKLSKASSERVPSEKQRQATSEANKRRGNPAGFTFADQKHSAEAKVKMSLAKKDKKQTPQAIKAAADARQGKTKEAWERGCFSGNGAKMQAYWDDAEWSKQTADKIRIANLDASRRAKIGIASKERYERLSEEERKAWYLGGAQASQQANPSSLEVKFGTYLDRLGVTYEAQHKFGPYIVDFYFPQSRTMVELYGCFWHGCAACGHDNELDKRKRDKDARRIAYLQRHKFTVHVLWEHELKNGNFDLSFLL